MQNNVITSRSWLSNSGKVHDNSNDSPLYSGSTEENLSREEQVTRLKNFAKKSGYTKDVTEPLLQEFNQSSNVSILYCIANISRDQIEYSNLKLSKSPKWINSIKI